MKRITATAGCFLLPALLFAQADANKGSITGTVSDLQRSPIPDAKVIATHSQTALHREATASSTGQYRLAALDPGIYEVRIESGTVAATVKDIVVTVGGTVTLNVNLALQASTQVVDLSTAILPLADSGGSQVLTRQVIRDLPIDGRRFQEFATLTPALLSGQDTRGQLSFAGQRGVNSNVMIDGTDYNEPFFGGIRGGERSTYAFTIPQSAIEEFQVVTTGYSVEYGRSTGGILNTVTRSGSNTLHGESFYQLRHHNFGAENPYKQEALERQHQFGGAIGGPVLKDRLFFFGAAERQDATFPRLVRFPALDTVASNVTPDIAPAYEFFRSQEGTFDATNDATAVLGRADYQWAGGSRLTGRYNYSRNVGHNAIATGFGLEPQSNIALSGNGTERNRTHTVTGQFTSVLTPSVLSDLRAQYSREERPRTPNSTMPAVEAGIVGSYGTRFLLPEFNRNSRLQFAEAVSIQAGSHAIKFGGDYNFLEVHRQSGFNQFGTFLINSSDPRKILNLLSRSGGPGGNRLDDPSVVYRLQVGGLVSDGKAHQVALFANDTWRLRPNIALSLGVRWEGQVNPTPRLDNDFLISNVRNFGFPIGRTDPTVIRDQLNQWSPRVGLSWNVGNDGRTTIRANAGIFYAQTPLYYFSAPLDNFSTTPADLTLQIAPGAAGTVYQQFAAAGFDFNATPFQSLRRYTVPEVWMDVAGRPNPFAQANVVTTSANSFRNPRSRQVTLALERQLTSGLILDYQWIHVNTSHLLRNIDYNVPRPFVRAGDQSQRPFFGLRSGTPRPNPDLGQVLVRDSSARSNYDGNAFRMRYRKGRLQLAAHYTLSFNKSDDDNERQWFGITYQNPFDLGREYNWSAFDSRHQAAGYAVFQGPWGLDLTGLFRFRSGLPIDASTGEDTSQLLSTNQGSRPLERPGLPFLRNSFRNRDFKTVDLRVLKSFPVTETARFQFSCELFNVFNIDNVAFIPASTFPNNPAFIYGLGILTNGQVAPVDPRFRRLRGAGGVYDAGTTSQVGTPFQAQLGVRFLW